MNVFRTKRANVADALTATTGGRHDSFFRQNTAERLIAEIGDELHSQYILSFRPAPARSDESFRPIRLLIADRPDLTVRTRAGYWLTVNPVP